MHSSENARRSQRRRPELNINTAGTRSLTRYSTAPQFSPEFRPPVPAKGNLRTGPPAKSSRAPTHSQNMRDAAEVETFLDMLTPVDMSSNKENDRPISMEPPRQPNVRDSHDLSLPQRHVRDSLMSNMLLSLDQFSTQMGGDGQAPNYDNPLYSFGGGDDSNRAAMGPTVRRRPNHGYTYSSDYEMADTDSRISSQQSRGRRSNSSSGFQSSLGRINSMRESLHRASQPGTPRMLHSRGGKGSKSSSTNSIDQGYAQVLSSQRWAQGFGARSSSFDYGQRPATTSAQQPWHIEFSNSFFNEDLDAAPTPTVPGGPRRLAPAPSMPSFPRPEPPPEPSPSKGPGVERKRSTRSSRSATVGRQAQSNFSTNDIPALPAFDLDSAPAPHVGYEKAKEPVPQTVAPLPPPKERGFFRKIFGGFRDTSADSPIAPSQTSPYVSSGSTETVGSRGGQHIINQMKTQSTPPSRESHHSSHGPTLQKKSSSFFRRRKKSVNDAAPPPPLPASVAPSQPVMPSLQLPKPEGPSKPEPSPATSLSRAMSPFLKQSATAPVLAGHEADDLDDDDGPTPPPRDDVGETTARNVRGFSPDYEPPPSAIIRPVHHSASNQDISSSSRQSKLRTDTPTRQPPQPPHPARSGSFLNDNSDSESSPKRVAQRAVEGYKAEPSPRLSQKATSSGAPSPITPLIKSPNSATTDDNTTPREIVVVDSTDDEGARLTLPIQSANSPRNTLSPTDGPRIRSSMSLPNVRVDTTESTPSAQTTPKPTKPIDEPEFIVGAPTEDDKQKAQKIFDGNEDFIQKEKAAAWMGEEGPVRQRTLEAYMALYDFQNSSIVNALRDVCYRLILRAETQQVDRILVAFSKRWCECNPNHGFKSTDVVHTTCYSIMLLNTDLHVADIESKMTRSQFVKNTMTTIRQALAESVPDAYDRPSILPGKNSSLGVSGEGRTSVDQDRTTSFRNSFISPLRSESSMGHRDDPDGCGPLVKAPFEGPVRAWEGQVEIVLKETYNSIRDDRLPLYGAEPSQNIPSSSSLSVMGMLKRTPSVLSKAPSEGGASTRGRINDATRTNTSRWASKSRSRARLGNNGFSSSRTSFDDNNSMWSPTPSSATWSRYSLGRTQGSGSMESFGSAFPRGDFQQSIGFANALSQAIDTMGSAQSLASDDMKSAQLLDDESLELAGPPWIKEGIVVHKHHLDGIDKKAKDRNWSEVFAVIQRGQMSIFSFSANKSTRSKARTRPSTATKGAVVGGGNWQENATNMGTFNLKQTLASALPPPGYSRTRPHVWALSLPTGAVHLFHVGTAEICKEFVTTANYWSARLSTHPLVGGISNIEYGWSDSIVHNSLVNAINNKDPAGVQNDTSRPGSAAAGRTSMQSRASIRSGSFDFGHVRGKSSADMSHGASRHGGSKLPGDKIHIADWQPPTQSLRPSNSAEPEQLQTLLAYVRGIEDELQAHNALRSPMLLAFTPRGHNANRAMANWERKSSYLLREIVKFRTYVDCLQEAERRRAEVYTEREVARRAARGEEAGSLGSEEDFAREFGMRGNAEDDEGEETLKPSKARA